jgi:hypothetical protein
MENEKNAIPMKTLNDAIVMQYFIENLEKRYLQRHARTENC